jgi:hypothetical protein
MNARSSLSVVVALAGCAGAPTAATPTTPSTISTVADAPAEPAATAAIASGCNAPDVANAPEAAATAGDRIDGCFEPGGGHDIYRFVVPGEGRTAVTLAITGAPDRVSTFVHVIGPTGERLAGGPAMAGMRKTDTVQLIADGGTTLLLDAYPNVDPREAQPWSIAITATPVAGEPDDDPRPLALGTAHDAAIEPWLSRSGELVRDVDRYSIEVAAAGTLTVRVDEPQHTLRTKLTVRDAAGKVVAAPRPPGLPKAVEATTKVAAGRYTIELSDVAGAKPFVLSTDDDAVALGYRLTATVQ